MTFNEKINKIFDVLGCTNATIARFGKIDPSIVSRFRTGARKPRQSSTYFHSFCHGIVIYAQKYNLRSKLVSACSLEKAEDLESELKNYLITSDEQITDKKLTKPKAHKNMNMFSDKLNLIMQIFGITNIRLARALSVDGSLVSRYRSGLRIPSKDSPIMPGLCYYISRVVKQTGREDEFTSITGISKELIIYYDDRFSDSFTNWLFEEKQSNVMDDFIDMLDMFNNLNVSSISAEDISADDDDEVEYTGYDGLRRAVLRFLHEVSLSKKTHELMLYSDQHMQWMYQEPTFMQKWTSMMFAVISNNNTIRIIHNIERNLEEMLTGIEKWLPIYLSGAVEGFCIKNSGEKIFTHTLFTDGETAAIYGCSVAGHEDTASYQYETDRSKIAYYKTQFDSLLAMSRPIIKAYVNNQNNEYESFLNELAKREGDMKRFFGYLPIATVPARLLAKMLERAGLDASEIKEILKLHDSKVKQIEKTMESSLLIDYITLPDLQDVSKGQISLMLTEIYGNMEIIYTPEEYNEHIRALMGLLKHKNYNVKLLTDNPFKKMKIVVKADVVAMMQKSGTPIRTLRFEHPLMCRTLGEYIDVLGQRYCLGDMSKPETVDYLQKNML